MNTTKIIKKKVISLISIVVFALAYQPAGAQMSDDAVVAYIKDGMSSGKSQNDIAQELAARGVTKAQAERIKNNYGQNLTSNSTAIKVAGVQERQRRMNDGIFETVTDSLEIIAKPVSIPEDISVYGRNIFTNRNLTFAPSTNLPTPVNYILGPGDEVIIDIWGANQATIRQTISPDGSINIPDVGVISLNGMTVKEADSYMRKKLGQIYSLGGDDAKSEIKLTLGNIRTIQVNVLGEVAVPGTYSLSSLSDLYHALYRAGGVSELGSLRDIQLFRKGKKVNEVDVYDFIFNGKSPSEVTLEEGDIIVVPTYGRLVEITGNVKRPMKYEMKDGETVDDLIAYAGGFAGNAYKDNLTLVRQNGKEYQVYTVDAPDFIMFTLEDGDVVTVGAMLDRFENRVEIKGAVYRPGVFELGKDVCTVKELIVKADGLKGDAFLNRALITREREDLTLEILPIDIGAIMSGIAPDVKLMKNDIIYIPSIHDLKDLGNITVGGEVAKPGAFVYAENTTLEDAIMLAGGLLESASTVKIDVTRRIKDAASMDQSETLAEVFTFTFKDGYVLDSEAAFILQPYDNIFVYKSPSYSEQTMVEVRGEVIFPGFYAISKRSERISDLVNRAGGVNQWAYIKGARLSRVMSEDELRRAGATLNIINSAKDSISTEQLYLTKRYFVGVDIEKALANPGCDEDLVIHEGDRIIIPQLNNTVRISGNVLYPNTVAYASGMTVRDYVEMAGGYGFKSKKSKAYVIYMNGTVARARRFSIGAVQPGCEIVVPKKREKDNVLQEILSISTTAASLGTMIATIGSIVKP